MLQALIHGADKTTHAQALAQSEIKLASGLNHANLPYCYSDKDGLTNERQTQLASVFSTYPTFTCTVRSHVSIFGSSSMTISAIENSVIQTRSTCGSSSAYTALTFTIGSYVSIFDSSSMSISAIEIGVY